MAGQLKAHKAWGLDDGKAVREADSFDACRHLAERYVVKHRNYYRRRATRVRRYFRWAGLAVILCSAALPVVAFVDGDQTRLIITVLSVTIAALTALRAFFQWDVQWRVLRQADWKLTYLLATWEIELEYLRTCPNDADPECSAINATKTLLVEAEKVVEAEASSFFRGLGWPEPDKEQVEHQQLGSSEVTTSTTKPVT